MSEVAELAPQAQVVELPKMVRYVALENISAANPYSFQDKNGVRSQLKAMPDQNIPNTDTVTMNGKETAIRYIAECSSIIVEEQVKMGYGKDYRFQDPDKIFMSNGEMVVFPQDQSNRYNYLEITNRNGTNAKRKTAYKPLFIKDDTQDREKKRIDKDRIITKAKSIIYQIEEDQAKLRAVAAQLTLDMNADSQALIGQLQRIAEDNPKLIIDAYGDSSGDIASLVWDAIEENIITFTGFGWEWQETKEKIAVKFQGRQKEDVARKKLVDFLLTEEGDPTKVLLEGLVKKRK